MEVVEVTFEALALAFDVFEGPDVLPLGELHVELGLLFDLPELDPVPFGGESVVPGRGDSSEPDGCAEQEQRGDGGDGEQGAGHGFWAGAGTPATIGDGNGLRPFSMA